MGLRPRARGAPLRITRSDENAAYDVQILPDFFSDHKVVTCKLDCPKPPASKIHVTYCSTKLLTADILQHGRRCVESTFRERPERRPFSIMLAFFSAFCGKTSIFFRFFLKKNC